MRNPTLDELNAINDAIEAKYREIANSPVEIGGNKYVNRHEALNAFSGRFSGLKDGSSRRKQFVDEAYAALRRDAYDSVRQDAYDKIAAGNSPSEGVPWWHSGSAKREYDRRIAEGRPNGSLGSFEGYLNSFASVDADKVNAAKQMSSPVGKGVSGSMAKRLQDAFGVAKDAIGLVSGGAADHANIDTVGLAKVARPSGRSGISEIDNSLSNIPVVTSNGIVKNGRLSPMTDADRRDVRIQNDMLNYDQNRGYVGR